MKKTALFSAAFLGASLLSAGAFAQSSPVVSGSTMSNENNASQSTEAKPLIPGNDSSIDSANATDRKAVAAGTSNNGETTGSMSSEQGQLVPGSGATFEKTPGQEMMNTQGDAVQDQSNTGAVKQ